MKYVPISEFLSAQAANRVRLSFGDVEKIIGGTLPRSAAEYQAWWANDPGHSQAKAWIEAGWQTENLNLAGRTVEFVRAGPRAPSPASQSLDPWGALSGTVTIFDDADLTRATGDVWEAEA